MIQFKEDSTHSRLIKLSETYKPDESKLNDMIQSVQLHGLLHPPVIKENMEIVTGSLRVLACQRLNLNIKVLIVPSNLTNDEYLEISLHENLKRGNLQWYDIVLKEKELHELRLRQNGVEQAKRGKKAEWGLRETANELNIALGKLAEDMQLANYIIQDPSLRKVQDRQTAKRVIDENIKRSRQELGVSKPLNIDYNCILHGSSEIVLKAYPNNIFDVCLTDPPWLEFKDNSLVRDQFTLSVFKEVYRILKANSFLYMFVSTQDWIFYFNELQKFGFQVQKFPLIWVKENHLSYGRKSWEYIRDYELILLAAKGGPAVISSNLSSIFKHKVIPSQLLTHPNEKPKELIRSILAQCSFDKSLILDPFAGSGSVLLACKEMGRRFVGIERDEKYYFKIKERLK